MNGNRMPHLNAVHLSGRLTKDPELRYTKAGVPVFNARVANNSYFRLADGEWQQETTYIGFVAWQALAERCYESLKKGSAVLVSGRLTSNEWEAEDGQKRSMIELRADRVQFLDRLSADDPMEEVSVPQDEPEEE